MFRYGEKHIVTKANNPEAYREANGARDMGLKEFVYRGIVFEIEDKRHDAFIVKQVRKA
jgi:hypothetical protein